MLERLREKRFYAKRRKCEFAKREIRYLGHLVRDGTVAVDPAKTEAV